jgi:hypothetical protein
VSSSTEHCSALWHPFDLFTKDETYALRQQSMTATRFILNLLLLIILIP